MPGSALLELPSDPAQPNDYLHMFVFSSATTPDIDNLLGCAALGDKVTAAWHYAIDGVEGRLPYAITPTCKLQYINSITLSISRELIEAATDLRPLTDPAYAFPPSNPFYVLAAVGDVCEFQSAAVVDGFTVTCVWSSSHATGNDRACVPASPVPYFGIATAHNTPIMPVPG